MEQTNTFFLIHNYNTVPDELLGYCRDYLIVDCSDDGKTEDILKSRQYHYVHVPNTGHNITSYFEFFARSLEQNRLPEVIALLKGNLIGRHCSKEFFERNYRNTWFTYLYEERNMWPRYGKPTPKILQENNGKDPSEGSIARLSSESHYLEDNTSWYVQQPTHPHRYFRDYDDLLRFIYQDPVIPKEVSFSPGACYIVRGGQVRLHGAAFYRNLNKLMNYTLDPGFPAEAYMVERMLPVILESTFPVNSWMEDEAAFDAALPGLAAGVEEKEKQAHGHFRKIRRLLRRK